MNNWKIFERVNLHAPEHRDARNLGVFAAGDDRAHEWTVELRAGSAPADLSGSAAALIRHSAHSSRLRLFARSPSSPHAGCAATAAAAVAALMAPSCALPKPRFV